MVIKKRILYLFILIFSITMLHFSAFSALAMEDNSDFTIDSNFVLIKYNGNRGDVVIPNGVKKIDSYAFQDKSNITSIIMPDTVTSIGTYCFDGFYNLKTIRLSSAIISIESYAFKDCVKLSSIDLPDSLSELDNNAFENCTSLTSVNLPKSLTLFPVGFYPFYGCSSLTSINVDKNNPNFTSENGVLFSKDKKRLLTYPAGKKDFFYTVPMEVERIDRYSFAENCYLKKINVPSTFTEIWDAAFKNCRVLETVEFPDEITTETHDYLGAFAFEDCKNLTALSIPKGIKYIIEGTFSGCENLSSLMVPSSVEFIDSIDVYKLPPGNDNLNPFFRCTSLIIYGETGSYVETYCKEQAPPIPFRMITDKLYADAFSRVVDAINNRTQQSINNARTAIEVLRKTDAAWAIGECSKQVDQIQHPMLVKIVNSIGKAQNTLKQSDINEAKLLIDPDLPVQWRTSYSSAIDTIQQSLITALITAHNKAIISKNQADINAENILLSEIETSIDLSIANWVDTYVKKNPNTL